MKNKLREHLEETCSSYCLDDEEDLEMALEKIMEFIKKEGLITPLHKNRMSTLSRMAGNIAAGLVTLPVYSAAGGHPQQAGIAIASVQIAESIIDIIEKKYIP